LQELSLLILEELHPTKSSPEFATHWRGSNTFSSAFERNASTGSPSNWQREWRIRIAIVGSHQQGAGHMRTYFKMIDHLKANDVDVASTGTVLGPLLTVDASAERFVGADGGIVASAKRNPLLNREGRGASKIPGMQTSASS